MTCFALSALLFTACDKEESGADASTPTYTLSISPETFAVGETFTITITGDNVNDYSDWSACYNPVGKSGNCLMPNFKDGSMEAVITQDLADVYGVGEYEFYAHSDIGDVKTDTITVTLTAAE